jgi:hypothetical protein
MNTSLPTIRGNQLRRAFVGEQDAVILWIPAIGDTEVADAGLTPANLVSVAEGHLVPVLSRGEIVELAMAVRDDEGNIAWGEAAKLATETVRRMAAGGLL